MAAASPAEPGGDATDLTTLGPPASALDSDLKLQLAINVQAAPICHKSQAQATVFVQWAKHCIAASAVIRALGERVAMCSLQPLTAPQRLPAQEILQQRDEARLGTKRVGNPIDFRPSRQN